MGIIWVKWEITRYAAPPVTAQTIRGPPSLSLHFNNATWLIGRRAHANSIIMIYETISAGYHTFSPELTTT